MFDRYKAIVGGSICKAYLVEMAQPVADTWTHVTVLVHEDGTNSIAGDSIVVIKH